MFKNLACLPEDPTFKLFNLFKADENPKKVNLGIGLYFDRESGGPFVLDVVKKAAKEIDLENFNYQPIGGNREFLELAAEFLFGDSYDAGKMAMQATCGGTQACRCFADLSLEVLHAPVIQLATPTWVNYDALFGALKMEKFEHIVDGEVNVSGYLEAAKNAPEGSAFLIQGALAHNPTGLNLSLEDLANLIDVLEQKKMILFMDMAYFGLSEGIEKDREYLRMCFDNLERFAVGVSFSKNASLYEHRCGALFVKTVNGPCTESQLQKSMRETISMPPGFGQEVMLNILKNYRSEWELEVEKVRADIEWRREELIKRLPVEFDSLRKTKGMFGMLPLSREQVVRLREEYSIYLLENGRINFAGIKACDLDYIAEGLKALSS